MAYLLLENGSKILLESVEGNAIELEGSGSSSAGGGLPGPTEQQVMYFKRVMRKLRDNPTVPGYRARRRRA